MYTPGRPGPATPIAEVGPPHRPGPGATTTGRSRDLDGEAALGYGEQAMGKFTVTHEINCNAERFWQLFFDKEFNDKLYREVLGFPKYEVLKHEETATQITHKVMGQPKLNLPGPVAKLLGANFIYTEEGSFDRATSRWTWKMTPSALADKMRNEGALRVEPIGADKVRRIAEITIEAKIFGVGGMIESSAEKQLREGWDDSAKFLNKYLAGAAT